MAEYPTSYQSADHLEATELYPSDKASSAAKNRYLNPQTTGAGFVYLQKQLRSRDLSQDSKELLRRLLNEHNVDLPVEETDDDDDDFDDFSLSPKKRKTDEIKTVDTSMSDETILQLARQVPSQMSLLGSLLKVIHDDGGSVSTRAFLKICALSVRPGLVPPHMDAKEMVLAALHFLSECQTSFDDSIPEPPWIRPVQLTPDLEKRVYEKVGNWSLAQILPAVGKLEEIFYSSGDDLKWMPRARFCPDVPNKVEQDLLLLKGNPPISTTKKVVRKKKTPAKSTNDSATQEATRIMSETKSTSSAGNASPDNELA